MSDWNQLDFDKATSCGSSFIWCNLKKKEKFIITNLKHYQNQDSIIASIIKNKLNEVWQSKWSVCESYIDDQNAFMNNLQNV